MREIKFRMWDIRNKKMIYHIDSIRFDIDDYLPFSVSIPSGARKSLLVNEHWIEDDGTYSPNTSKEAELMQYTGLKDKNGREIYEGDILECHHKTKGNVFFHDGSYRLSSDQIELNVENNLTFDDLNNYLIEDNNLVVIGNIFGNPGMLEGGQ